MTDPGAFRGSGTYIEPLTREYVEEIISHRVGRHAGCSGEIVGKLALLPTVGGQTALNLAVDLADDGHSISIATTWS